ncbi:acetyl-lysine deacetylase [Halobacteriales archaeon QS_3_64_16]|nr:MAG: acetyl-lysine deacetylase [Halobacteriales archaeon QS_3_64_16]
MSSQRQRDRPDARELLVDLVSLPSPSGEERACCERLVDFFESHGREVWIDDVGNVRAPADDSVLLTSHVDTVPGDIPVEIKPGDESETSEIDAESSEIPSDDVSEQLWGRGSVDATGALAAMAAAAIEEGVSFAGVVREEVDSGGARHLLDTREAPDTVVNGEPSGWEGITLGYRGLLAGTYVATSESGHTSRPENNAIQDAMDWWRRVEEELEPDEWTPVFERVTTKPVGFAGGSSTDGLSVEATMDVQLRVPPAMTAEGVEEIADGVLNGGTVQWKDRVEPVMQSPRTPVARAFRAAIRRAEGDPRLLRKTGTSDMNIFRAWDCPMVTYGPGDSDLDHAPNEHLALAEFDRSLDILRDAAATLAGN